MGASAMARAVACVLVTLVVALAAQENDIVPESLVEEMAPDVDAPQQAGGAVGITRDCFQRTCSPAGCNLARMPCRREAMAPWAVFVSPETQENRLVSVAALKKEKAPGLLDIVEHKKPLNPNEAITMPGVPAEASPHLLKAMKKRDQ